MRKLEQATLTVNDRFSDLLCKFGINFWRAHIAMACEDHWEDRHAIHLGAYTLWKLN